MAEPAYWQSYSTLKPFGDELGICDPRDGSFVGAIPIADPEQVAEFASAARRALPGWRATPISERCAMLRRIADAMMNAVDRLAEWNERETGRHASEAAEGIRAGASTLLQYAEHAPLHRGNSLRGPMGAIDFDRREPRGVAALLTPWNDPVAVACGLIGAALAEGNTVLYKPSERCPHTGALLGELMEAVLPPDVLHTVIGGPRTGEELVAEADVVAHVGSSATGEKIARLAALTGAHVVRENGGNDALIVDCGVDAAWAAGEIATGAFANAGQICTSVERVYLPADIADDVIAALTADAAALNAEGALGPLVDETLRESVHGQVANAIESGAVAVVGGRIPPGPGCYYPATVLTGCTDQMEIMREETFGPVAPIAVVEDFDAALAAASLDRFGLAATVLTSDLGHALAAADRLPVGTLKVNGVFGGAPGGSAQPRGASGSGFGYGPELLDELSTVKVVHIQGSTR